MTVNTRKVIRDQLAGGLKTAHGSRVAAVYGFMATKFEGTSPVVRIMNAGSLRPRRAGVSSSSGKSAFRYVVQHFVRFDEGDGLDRQQEDEDRLDEMEQVLLQFMSDEDQQPDGWMSIEQVDYSEPALVKIGSYQYLIEVFQVEVRTYDG